MLKDVGFSAGAVGLALRDTFGHDAESALGLLIDAGFSERLAEGAMLEAYNRLFAITDFKQVTCASTECTEDDFSTVRPDYIPVSFLNCTEPYVPGMIGERGDPTQYLASLPSPRSKTLWVKYELIDINSQTAVLVDLPTLDPASAVYQPMGEVDTYIANLAATLEHRRPATCEGVCSAPPSPGTPAIDSQFLARMASWENSEIDWPTSVCSANGGYWSMIRLPELVGLTTEDVPVYLWHSVANKRWPIMPANVDSVTDFSKERYLRGHAPVVRLPWDVHFYPVSVDWHFDHTQRSIQPGEYPPYLWVELDGSDDTQDFFYGEPRALDDIPMYAFWLEKPITLGDGEQIEVVDLVYYAFYSWNQGKYIVFAWRGNHVGDWEHVSIRLMWHYIDEAETTGWTLQPTQVYVGAHDRNSIYDWDTFPKLFGAQPIAYKAWGSNGFWPGPGRWHYNTIDIGVSTIRLADECTTGDLWNPASSLEPYLFNPDAIAVQTHLTARRYDCGISRANPEGYSLIDYSWPIWLSDCVADDRFSLFGQPSDPRDGPIEEWGNRECMCSSWGECPSCGCWIFCMLVGGPNGPADKLWQIHRNPRLR